MHRRRKSPPGTAPGTLVVDPESPRPILRVMAYGPDEFTDRTIQAPEEIPPLLERWPVTWVNIDGLGDVDLLRRVQEVFGLHRLALEDVVNVHQRAKVEQYGDHLFIVGRMVSLGARLETEQISLFLGSRFVLTFQERPGDCLDPVRERIGRGTGRLRQAGADYLAYALLDAVVDHYFPLMEEVGERLESLQDEVIQVPEPGTVARVNHVRHDLIALRRAIWPLREAVGSLYRDPTDLIVDETRLYLRDCYDHAVQIMDMVESSREIASGLMDVYMSSVGNRMNEVMKTLTIFAAVFIPLSFIAGLYGMNFNTARSPWNLPELDWYFGYPFALGIMGVVATGLLLYLRSKGWLGDTSRSRRGRSREQDPSRPGK